MQRAGEKRSTSTGRGAPCPEDFTVARCRFMPRLERPASGVVRLAAATAPALLVALLSACHAAPSYAPANGDIVFHTSRSSQSVAIQRATHSKYSHMGIVYVEQGRPFVYEAVQPVKLTPLADWVRRGEGGHFVVRRLRRAGELLTPENLGKLRAEGNRYRGKPYDLYFEWSDDRIYCSELVWKMYQRALGIEIGRLQRLGEFDLSDPAVAATIRERWRTGPPQDEIVISPDAIFHSEELVTVYAR